MYRTLTLERAHQIRAAIAPYVEGVEILPTLDPARPVMIRVYERDGAIYETTANRSVRWMRSLYV